MYFLTEVSLLEKIWSCKIQNLQSSNVYVNKWPPLMAMSKTELSLPRLLVGATLEMKTGVTTKKTPTPTTVTIHPRRRTGHWPWKFRSKVHSRSSLKLSLCISQPRQRHFPERAPQDPAARLSKLVGGLGGVFMEAFNRYGTRCSCGRLRDGH